MTERIDEQGRPEPKFSASEEETLLGYIDFLRATFAWKLKGLSEKQLRSTPLRSSMSLIGMAKHLAFVEDFWFVRIATGGASAEPWKSVIWDDDPDWDWNSAAKEPADDVVALWEKSVEDSRAAWDKISSQKSFSLEDMAPKSFGEDKPSFRWILAHMIEEYGRHCGHADLLREEIDGATGE